MILAHVFRKDKDLSNEFSGNLLLYFFLQPNTYLMCIPYYIFNVPQDMAYFSNIC